MDLKELNHSIRNVILKVSFFFLWIVIIGNIGVVLLSGKIGSGELEAFGGTLLAGGVIFIMLRFVRHSIRNK